ncbi:MAG: 4-phosphopantetheinyl transferase family protein, partial [Rhodobacteraceae bacterium]
PIDSDLWDTICTTAERAALDALPIVARGLAVKRIFCVKEAVYKAQFTLTGALLDFDAVDVAIHGRTFTATFRSPPPGLPAPVLGGRITETPAGYLAALAIPRGTP